MLIYRETCFAMTGGNPWRARGEWNLDRLDHEITVLNEEIRIINVKLETLTTTIKRVRKDFALQLKI